MALGVVTAFPKYFALDNNGNPLQGGRLYVYVAGTSTPATTYSDVDLTIPNTNPVILDSGGRATIFVAPGSYKFVQNTFTDAAVWSQDNISSTSFTTSIFVSGVSGETIGSGASVYLSQGDGGRTAGRWYLMDADFAYASSLAVMTGWANTAIPVGAAGQIQLAGSVAIVGLVAGLVYYASATAGAITTTPPVNRRIVGVANTAGTLLLGVEQAWTATAQPLTIATSPAAGVGGALIRRTDGTRGLFLDSGAQWVSVNGGVANVRDFGALGDGTTNDRVAIQAAIDAASTTIAGVVWFPTGNYRVDVAANVGLTITKAVTLKGASSAGVTIRGHGMTTGDNVIHINGTTSPDLNYVHFSGLTVMSNDANRPDLIKVNRVSACTFRDVVLRDGRHGMVITGNRSYSQVYQNIVCTTHLTGDAIRYDAASGGEFSFYDCSFNANIGVSMATAGSSLDSISFYNCNWEACNQAASFTSTGAVRTINFFGGRAEKNLAPFDFSPGAAGVILGVVFKGMSFETDVETYAINFSGTGSVTGVEVSGCWAKDYSSYFVRLIDGDGGWICHNTLENTPAPVNDYTRSGMVVLNNRTETGAVLGPQWGTTWTTPTFAAGNFTANGAMTWTVGSGDVQTYAYHIIGKLMTVLFRINTSTVVAVVNTQLLIAIPDGRTATKYTATPFIASDNGAANEIGLCDVIAAGTKIRLSRLAGTNWTAAVDTTTVMGQITFEIDTP